MKLRKYTQFGIDLQHNTNNLKSNETYEQKKKKEEKEIQ